MEADYISLFSQAPVAVVDPPVAKKQQAAHIRMKNLLREFTSQS
jgi:hypothetical protein